eukprot:196217-Chlamydomonas_euryale.AAC.7
MYCTRTMGAAWSQRALVDRASARLRGVPSVATLRRQLPAGSFYPHRQTYGRNTSGRNFTSEEVYWPVG